MKASDLIGKEWTCPSCSAKVVITTEGIEHSCRNFWCRHHLDDLYRMELMNREYEQRVFFGEYKREVLILTETLIVKYPEVYNWRLKDYILVK